MSGNDASTGGYLVSASVVVDDDGLDDFFQAVVVGVTGMSGALVRPRWQAEPPLPPAVGTTWCSIGVTDREKDTYGAVIHDADGEGTDTLVRHETLKVLASFYGPSAGAMAEALSDGLQIAQNREVLQLAAMGLRETGNPVRAPELIKETWWNRIDLPVFVRRAVQRTYPILNLQQVVLSLVCATSGGTLTIPVNIDLP